MSSAAADVPAETDLLCEHCGYGLNGLPPDGRCPECGEPIADSTIDDGRRPSVWDDTSRPVLPRFVQTTAQVIFKTGHFYRHLATRLQAATDARFASLHRWIAAVFLGTAAGLHAQWLLDLRYNITPLMVVGLVLIFIVAVRVALAAVITMASRLTRWEGTYRGYRLPADAVRRVMNFHSAQLLPVSVIACATVVMFRLLVARGLIRGDADVKYLYTLSGEVVIGAMYLFWTYWTAMRNILYANR